MKQSLVWISKITAKIPRNFCIVPVLGGICNFCLGSGPVTIFSTAFVNGLSSACLRRTLVTVERAFFHTDLHLRRGYYKFQNTREPLSFCQIFSLAKLHRVAAIRTQIKKQIREKVMQ